MSGVIALRLTQVVPRVMVRICLLVSVSFVTGIAVCPAMAQDSPLEAGQATSSERREPELRFGTGEFIRQDPDRAAAANQPLPDGGFSASYRDADVGFVVNQVLGEFLGLDYTVANDVRGQVTLRMEDVQTRGEAMQRLRNALAAIGVSLIDRGDFVAVVRGSGATGGGSTAVLAPGDPVPPGTGVIVLTLNHAPPSSISQLVGALAANVRVAVADDERRIIILTGDAEALTAASSAVALMDVDWFRQISTGIFELHDAAVDELAGELRSLMGTNAVSVEIIPLERLNTLIVMSPSRDGLLQARAWIDRLDRPRVTSSSNGQLVYTVRHADPTDLLNALYQLLGMGQNGQTYTGGASGYYGREEDMAQTGERGLSPRPGIRNRNGADDLQIGAAPNQNLIMVRGSEARVAEVAELLQMLDRPRAQVLIEAAIIEVTLTDEMSFGIDWSGLINEHVGLTFANNSSGAVTARYPGLSATYLNTDIEVAISALSSATEVEVISRPSILALHNEQAELQVGDQVPVVLQSAVSVNNPDAPIVNQTAYRNTGVILSVTPQVRAGGMVEIDVVQEVSGVAQTTSSGIDSPTITQRRISSTLLVPSNQSVALGGLISTRRTHGESGVPGLRRAPVIGRLFRSESEAEDRTELLVIMTPRIITDPYELGDAMLSLPSAVARLEARIREQ